MRKIIKNKNLVPVTIADLNLDDSPDLNSTDPVTSRGIASAITEAVGGASDALQEQIDDIAEKAGSGYTPKGPASVATLNGLTGQENGWLYTMTDAGTLTDGSLAVTAGDTVAWDATNSVWYKAMDYAPSQYGTNEVHNLSTTITSFRTGDVIPVDGPSGSAKMSKDDLLKETAENAVNSGVAADQVYVGLFGPYDLSTTTEYNYVPGSWGSWYTPGKHKSLKIVNGATYKIGCKTTSESNGAVAILNSTFVEGNSQSGAIPFSTNHPARVIIIRGDYFEFTASEGDAYICFITENGNGQDIDYTVDVRAGALGRVYDEVEELAEYVGVFENEDFSTIAEYDKIVSGWGSWYTPGKHKSIKLNKGLTYVVACLVTSENDGVIAILNSSFVEGDSQSGAVPFSTNHPARITVNRGNSFSFEALDDDVYLIVISENSLGEQLDYAVKIVSGLSKKILDDIDSGTAEVRLKILEYNVGGFDNGLGFVDPSVDVCKDLHHFICDNAPDIFVPCEVINSEANFWKTMRAIFSQVNTLPSSFGTYSAIANLNIGGVQYTKLYFYKDAATQSSPRAQLMASFEIAGCKIAFVPWHGQTLNGTWAGLSWDTIEANLDNWFEQINEESYDVVLLCGDTNVFWNTDSDIGLANNYNIVQYFLNKGYCYVNGGRGSTSQQVDLDFTNNFAEDTYINPAGHIPGLEGCVYNIDNLVMRSVSGKFNIAATFKVFSDAYMLANYPNLRGATYPDHIPVLFEVKISKV